MSSLRSFKSYSSIVWYCDPSSTRQHLVDELVQNGFEVEVAYTEEDLKDKYRSLSPTFFVIDHPTDLKRCIELVASGKRHAKDSAFATVLLTDQINTEDKEAYFQANGDEILSTPICAAELLFKIKHYQNLFKNKAEFSFQLEEASQMALLAMENSSDLGGILNFVKHAMNSKSYDELAEQIFNATHPYSDSAIVEIKGHENFYYFASSGQVDADMKRYLIAQKNGDRVVKSESIIQINNQNLVVLLDGLPENDPEKMGRISDTVVMLCDTANRFVESISIEESLAAAEESRRKFLTTLSHELRTPLNGVLGFSKALRGRNEDAPLGKTGLDALERIIDSTDQINTIISTLIDISSVSSGKNDLAQESIDLNSLALKLNTKLKEQAIQKALSFEVDAPPGLTMLGDATKIYSMLHHLVDNAIKFTNTGGVKVSFSTDFNPSLGQRIIFKVSDTGIGIAPKDQERIFSEIGQLNNEHNREHYGVGIGLYYVNLLSRQFGGSISVNSSLNEGAEFTLNLPSGEIIKETSTAESDQEQEIDDLLF